MKNIKYRIRKVMPVYINALYDTVKDFKSIVSSRAKDMSLDPNYEEIRAGIVTNSDNCTQSTKVSCSPDESLIDAATELFKSGDLEKLRLFIRSHTAVGHSISPNVLEHFAVILSEIGDMDDALDLLVLELQQFHKDLEQFGLRQSVYRFINHKFTGSIGHIAILEVFYKLQRLGMLPGWVLRIHRHDTCANLPLLDKMAELIPYTLLSTSDFSEKLYRTVEVPLSVIPMADGSYRGLFEAGLIAETTWLEQGRGPVLSLTEEERERGADELSRLGIPTGAWFVGLHVRDEPGSSRDLCNADIKSYVPAIQRIVERGGYVVRIGDKRMPPLDPIPHVIDLSQLEGRNQFLDMFVCAASKFFIGTSSGPLSVPHCFGVPCIYSNAFLFRSHWYDNYIRIPVLYQNADNELMRIKNVLSIDNSTSLSRNILASKGLFARNNTEQDIVDAVEEMFSRLDGTFYNGQDYEEIQRMWREIPDMSLRKYKFSGLESTMSKFAATHAWILE